MAYHKLQFSVVDDNQVEKLHTPSLHVLENYGAKISDESVLKELEKSGANVDHHSAIVKFPEEMVEELIVHWLRVSCCRSGRPEPASQNPAFPRLYSVQADFQSLTKAHRKTGRAGNCGLWVANC